MHLHLVFSNPHKSNTKVEICGISIKLCQDYIKHYKNSKNMSIVWG